MRHKLLFFLLFNLLSSLIIGATKTFTGPGNFSDPTKWNGSILPSAGDDLRINGSCTFDNAANNFVYATLIVGSGTSGSLIWPSGGTNTLNVTAVSSNVNGSSINMNNGGTLQIRTSWATANLTFTAGSGTIHWNVTSGNSTLPAGISAYNNLITSTGNAIVSLGAATTVNNNITINTGTFRTGGVNLTCKNTFYINGTLNDNNTGGTNNFKHLTINAGGIINNTVNETYNISGNFTMFGGTINGNGTGTYNITGNLLILSGTNNLGEAKIVVAGTTSVSAVLNANSTVGSKTLNDFIVTSSGTFNCTVNEKWRFNGNVQVDGVFNAALALYTFAGINKTISGTAAIVFDDIKCTGSYTNNANVKITTSLTGNGTWTQGATGVLNLAITDANFTVSTFNASVTGNTVNYLHATSNQKIRTPNDGSYGNLGAMGGAIKTLTTNLIAKGNITISSSLDVTNNNFNITLGGNWTNTGSFLMGTGTSSVTFNGTGTQTISKTGGETFSFLVFSGAGTKTFLSPVTVNKSLFINTGAPVDVGTGNNQITVKGDFSNSGTFNSRQGLVLLNGTAAQSITGTSVTDFYDLTLNNTAGASITNAENLIGTLTLNNGTFNTNAKVFTMISTASNTARIAQITGSGNISGNVTVQRFAPGGSTGWTLLGAPITSALTFADWDDDIYISCPTCPDGSAAGFLSIYTYDETVTGLYDNPAAYVPLSGITDPIKPNTGYWVYLGTGSVTTTNITMDVTGTVGKFATSIPLKYTNTGVPANDGWNLITNPYPSAISWNAFKGTAANLDNAIYAYNPDLNAGAGSHATYVNNISSPAVGSGGIGDAIPMGQGFYVHVTGPSTITAQESNKVAGNPTFLKTNSNTAAASAVPLLRLHLKNTMGHDDETVLYLQSGANDTFDNSYDAFKMRGQDPYAPVLALEKGSDLFQINGVAPISGNFSMPLKALTGYSGTYTISPENISSFPAGACINLYDVFTNTNTNLKTNSYVFTLADTTTVARFRLNITMNPLTINTNINNPTCTQPNSGEITAIGTNSGPWDYYWKNSVGTVIKTSLNKTTADTLKNLSGSTYTVEVNTAGMCDNNTTGFNVIGVTVPTSQFACEDTTYLSLGAQITCTNSSSNASGYYWDFGDGLGFSGAANPTYNYSSVGTYTVSLISTSSTGCNDTTTKIVVVSNNITTGINTNSIANNLIIKTLSDNEFMIEQQFDSEKEVNCKLYDGIGRLISDYGRTNTRQISFPVNLKDFSSGIYFFTITISGESKVIKLPVK